MKKLWVLPLFAAISFYIGYSEQAEVRGGTVSTKEVPLLIKEKVVELKPEPEPPKPIVKKPTKKLPIKRPASKWKKLWVTATAYCPCSKCCYPFNDGITATGKNAYTKGVAVDKRMIPLGSIMKIPGYGTVKADDVGGAIKGRKIDVRFKYHWEARKWGRKYLRIEYLPLPTAKNHQ